MKSGPCFITAPITLDKMGIINCMVLLLECVLKVPRATKVGALLCSGSPGGAMSPPKCCWSCSSHGPNLTGTALGHFGVGDTAPQTAPFLPFSF